MDINSIEYSNEWYKNDDKKETTHFKSIKQSVKEKRERELKEEESKKESEKEEKEREKNPEKFKVAKTFNTLLSNDSDVYKSQKKKFKSSKRKIEGPKKEIPEVFNPFDTWGIYLSRVKTQGDCGCCWAMATAKALQDRYALISNGRLLVELSPFMMVMCEGTIFPSIPSDQKKLANINLDAHSAGACNGNTLYTAMDFLYAVGLTTTTCINRGKFDEYNIKPLETIVNPESIPMCQSILGVNYDRCLDRSRAVRFHRTVAGYQVDADIESIKQEIYKWGPVAAGFQIYDDFINKYDGTTIYMGPSEKSINQGGHAIEIVGWGKEDGVDFWWICNSWGPDWGLGGYFKMKMNIEKCQLEQNVVGFIPDYPGFKPTMLQYDIIKNADMTMLREWLEIDPITGYKFSTIDEIKKGQLQGELIPIIDPRNIPDMSNFWLGEINNRDIDVYYSVSRFYDNDHISIKELLFLCILFIISYVIGKWISSPKHKK